MYAAGIKYLAVSVILLTLGIPVYAWARREQEQKTFTKNECFAAVILVIISLCVIYMVMTGKMVL